MDQGQWEKPNLMVTGNVVEAIREKKWKGD
jgi:hypothetical protein